MKTLGKLTGAYMVAMLFFGHVFATEYTVNKPNTTVKWKGEKVVGEHYGTIELKSGVLQTENDRINSGTFLMDMTSIVNEDLSNETMNKKLVDHLKSDDFFSVSKYPVSSFVLKEVKPKSDNVYTFTGDLTIKGITHTVTFDATVQYFPGKVTALGKIEVDRTLYDIRYGSGKFFSGLGDNMIRDTFTLDFNVTLTDS
jgi:polyisoprenoid-binding protein YceI